MKMKLIMSLLMLCIAFSIGSAMAQTESMGNMEKSSAGINDRMAGSPGQVVVVMAGNVTGKVTYGMPGNMNQMGSMAGKTGMAGNESKAGNMGSPGKTMTRNINGHLLIVKDIEKNTENIVIIGKIDGMSGKAIIVGKIDHNMEMGEAQNKDMNVMAGNMDNMAGETDDQKVIVTGTINCNMIGDMVMTGKTGAMKGMEVSGSRDMAEMSGAGDMEQSQPDNMAGPQNNEMNVMAGNMDNKNVIATGTVNCDVTGDLVIIGQLGAIKEMVGQKEKSLTGKMIATVETGNKKAEMSGSVKAEMAKKMGSIAKPGNEADMAGSMKADMAEKMGTMAESGKNAEMYGPKDMKADMTEKMGNMENSGSCAAELKNNDMNGMSGNMDSTREKMGKIREKMGNFDIMMSGIVRCKMTGINLVVVGKADEMAEMMGGMTEKYGMMAGKEGQSCMTAAGMENNAGTTSTCKESQTCGQNKAQSGTMTGMTEMSGMTTGEKTTGMENNAAMSCTEGQTCSKNKAASGTSAQESQGEMKDNNMSAPKA